jgi:hypothetical protein
MDTWYQSHVLRFVTSHLSHSDSRQKAIRDSQHRDSSTLTYSFQLAPITSLSVLDEASPFCSYCNSNSVTLSAVEPTGDLIARGPGDTVNMSQFDLHRVEEALRAFQSLIEQVEGIQPTNSPPSAEDLAERDRRRSNPQLFTDWDALTSTLDSLPSAMDMLKDDVHMNSLVDPEHYLDTVENLKMMLMSRKPFMELYRKIAVMFPIPKDASAPMPHQLAAASVAAFKSNVLVPLVRTKMDLRHCREKINDCFTVGQDVPPCSLVQRGHLEDQVQDLVALSSRGTRSSQLSLALVSLSFTARSRKLTLFAAWGHCAWTSSWLISTDSCR